LTWYFRASDVRALDALVLLPGRLVLQSLVDPQQHAGALADRIRAAEGEVELSMVKKVSLSSSTTMAR